MPMHQLKTHHPNRWFFTSSRSTRAPLASSGRKVSSDVSSLTTTGHPLASSTRLMTVRVTSRSVIYFSDNDGSSSESKIEAVYACFLSSRF
jgi:hypothetical protein